jgi:hypothetical protein
MAEDFQTEEGHGAKRGRWWKLRAAMLWPFFAALLVGGIVALFVSPNSRK